MADGRLAGKLFLAYAVVVVTTALATGWSGARLAERHARESIRAELVTAAGLLELIDATGGADRALQAQLQERFGDGTLRLTLIAGDGVVIADSHFDAAAMANHNDRPEVIAARAEGEGEAGRHSDTAGIGTRYYARVGVDPAGPVYRASLPLTTVTQRVVAVRLTALAIGAAVTVLALVIGLAFARHLTRPLRQLTRNAAAIARGERVAGVATTRRDEIGDLARTFNRMAEELDRRHQDLAGEHAKIETILGGMVEGVVAIDAGEKVLHLNASGRRLLGIAADVSVVGESIWQVCTVTAVAQAVTACLLRRESQERELTIGEGGDRRHFSLQAEPLVEADGSVAGAVGVLHDITRLKQLEEVRRDFVADISHEIKTPLTTIIGMVDTVRDDPAMSAETRAGFLGRVISQAERLDRLTSDLLTISRLEAGEPDRERHRCSLGDLVRTSHAACQPLAREAGVDLALELPAESISLDGDPEGLGQAIDNLVANAVKYTPAGGRVGLALTRDGDEAVVTVRDTGIGIAAEEQTRIFRRFYRVDKARSRELGGTGLGLAIVKHVALDHGGRVEVESEEGKGSVFRLVVPLG